MSNNFSNNPIYTSRLLLRPLHQDDAEELFLLDSDPEVKRYLGGITVKTIEEVQNSILDILKQYEDFNIGRWAVIERDSQKFAGWSGLKYNTREMNGFQGYYDMGFRLKPQFWGKGYATESGRAWKDIAKTQIKTDYLYAMTDIKNINSMHALMKLGFEKKNTFYDNSLGPVIECQWFELHLHE